MSRPELDALFNEAAAAHRRGDIVAAKRLCRQILEADNNHLGALFALATLELARGDVAAAESRAARMTVIDPMLAAAHAVHGQALAALDRSDAALAAFDRALALDPRQAETWFHRGNLLAAMDRADDALDSFAKAVPLMSDPAPALYNQGTVLFALGRFEDALRCYDAAIAREPDHPVTHNNRGNVLRELNRPEEALAAYDRAIALDPSYAAAYNNRGIVLQPLDRATEALASFDRAIALAPNDAEAFYNRGIALSRLNRLGEALASQDRALALNPDHAEAASEAFVLATSLCDWRGLPERVADLTGRIRAGQRVAPFAALGLSDDPALQAQAAITTARAFDRMVAQAAPLPPRAVHARLRLAYLSADFRNHVVGHTLAALFERHDRAAFEVWGVALGSAPDSAIRRRLAASFDHFVDASHWSDRATAAFLRDHEIDIAVDLMGHTQGSRIAIFAHRAAPLQVNYFGYPGTTGAAFMDYIIADRITLPERVRAGFSERVVHLPDTYLPADTSEARDGPIPPRGALGLPETGFVYCNFNTSYKITPSAFAIWMRLLGEIEGSVLWLYAREAAQANLRREAATRGIDANRLIFAPPLERAAHLARMRAADLFLDTLPYNAHNTASEALWAGLPLITCTGEAFAARVATSVLTAAGLAELATNSLDAYERLARDLARDPNRLAALRGTLTRQRQICTLFDGERYRRHLEAAYRMMWDRHQRGEPPQSFAVAPLA